MALQRPDMFHGVAFNADPNDPTMPPVWTDLGHMVLGWDRNQRGRNYELARTMGADPKVSFRDPNEYLNPANTSSPYYPFAQPYRESLHLATWPAGATGNLLNLNNWRVPFDGSMESYTLGTTPEWVTESVTDSGPVIAGTAHAGSKSLEWGIGAGTHRQGIAFNVPCVPGQQYTTSGYVRQNGASTQIIRMTDQTLAAEPFRVAAANGWGTPPVGGAWANGGGVAADRSVTAATPYADGYGSVSVPVGGSRRLQTLTSLSAREVLVSSRFAIDEVAVGGYIAYGHTARWTDDGNHYYYELRFQPDQSVDLLVFRRVAAANTQIGSTVTLPGVRYRAGDQFFAQFQVVGSLLRVGVWRDGQPPVDLDEAPTFSGTDTNITAAGAVGVRFVLEGATTNPAVVARTFNFSCVGTVEGSSTTTVGSYVRLSVTYTATQPTHRITVATTGTSVTCDVNLDSVMHNTGAAAGTFTTTGSTIYPVMRPFVERWTRRWESVGFEGYSDVPAVDALSVLQSIGVPPPVDAELARSSPDYVWKLDGGAGATAYPETSGNGGPTLGLNISKFGVGELPTGGAAIDIPGGGQLPGVRFTPPNPASGSTVAGTVLGCGPLADDPANRFQIPAVIDATDVWRITVAMWVTASDTGSPQTAFYPSRQLSSTAGAAYIPCYVDIDGGTGTGFTNVGADGTVYALTSGDGLSGINLLDGEVHLLVGITVQDPTGDTIVYRFIDDVLDGVNLATTASLGGVLRGRTDSLSVGATDDGARFLAVCDATISRLAVWNRELTSVELTWLYQAGLGWIGDTSGQRLTRDLEAAGYTGATRIGALDEGDPGSPITTMGAPGWAAPYDAQADLLAITEAEQGCSWVAPDGALVLEGRADRFSRLTPSWYLGENEAGGEAPYLEGVEFDFDPTFVFADVSVARRNGGSFSGGLGPDVAATRRRFFPLAFGFTADYEDDSQAQDAADWIYYTHRFPGLRVGQIELDPASNPDLWPLVLGIEVGQRVRVVRRAKAANAGAGLTMTADFFVETVTHHEVDYERGTWRTTLLLSPIGTGPGVTVQPWILEDATLSVLGSTTVLGF